ncbi:MAG: SDR family oxidoreductase [Candidatus Pseudobacter hemicellulosilyticus]|uniref:SDR family oxidoreductase n=1 Tax=Candidatus Pseudobacter hemicellulosilyticus TaxID=3121375 RepID=A0AAJ5WQQ9_9BACT|nr:MAG: SDR family oxidoreductase [Pseudobacter sp.]
MRVFVTGASGFVGSAVVQELLSAGHQVLGMVRSDSAAEKLAAAGAEVHRGDLYDLESIKSGATGCDAVIHTAFNHDFTRFKENCETDRQVIGALTSVLAGTDRPLVVTSGLGLLSGFDRPVTENDNPKAGSDSIPRMASEEAAHAAAALGVNAYIVRLPPTVHGQGDHGFISILIGIAKEKGQAAYIGEGNNYWPAVHRLDAAALYRLIVEKRPALKVLHAAGEEGIPFREIATAIGNGLQLPVVGKPADEAAAHFSWFTHFAGMDCKAPSEQTRSATGWQPHQPTLLPDLEAHYFTAQQ